MQPQHTPPKDQPASMPRPAGVRRHGPLPNDAETLDETLVKVGGRWVRRGDLPVHPQPGTCEDKPHFCCKECGCDTFYLEKIGYGHRILLELDNEDHRLLGEIERDADDRWKGPWRFYLRCDNCYREIEFGWSHPDRGGRIWPVEASCFNPWKSWPEPRYRKSWQRRGWLRPSPPCP